ncbi:FAD-binding oxidoreductase [Nocardia sp. NPDC049190]|uniref:FAD-binding oxidoreductase n=1 Tax=Nocardia sp. NPDC049190 TaxID=3155650 RepID=UPI0033CEB83C
MTESNSGTPQKRRPFEVSRRTLLAAGSAAVVAACANSGAHASASDNEKLRSMVRGRVLLPGDAGFDHARKPWNLAVEQPVDAVVEVADAAALVRYARDAGRRLTIQPNGHGASGATGGAILVRTNRLGEIRVDPGRRTARVGAGVSWGRLQDAASPHGLTGMVGSSPAVSVTGYVLGGGLSWFSRAAGWAADSVTAFDVVDAQGRALHVTASCEPDLFWALRGGGGDYTLVTAVELDVRPVPALYGGGLRWPAERAPQVMAAFQEITAAAPQALTLWWSLTQIPFRPAQVGIDVLHLGDTDQARALLRPLEHITGPVADTRRVLPLTDLGTIGNEPAAPTAARSRTELLTHLDPTAVDNILTTPIPPLITIRIRHLGGALARQTTTAPGPMTEPYQITFVAPHTTPQTAANIDTSIRTRLESLGETRSGRTPFTFLAPGQTAADAVAPDTLRRLRTIKQRLDPQGIFRSNYPVG